MQRYRIRICGENFLLDLDGDHGKFGFTATRVIRANSRAEAERIALIRIYQELNQETCIVKKTPDAPRVYTEATEELKFYQFSWKKCYSGFVFISEDL